MDSNFNSSASLAARLTGAASKQSYYTIRWLVDRERIANAFRAYAYFRWLDDRVDAEDGSTSEKISFVNRQKSLLESCYRGETCRDLCAQEWMLAHLVASDSEQDIRLRTYLFNMMEVVRFDVGRRGQVVSQAELSAYTSNLASAVTEAIYYFIGHDEPVPYDETRYLAVTAAHIAHMLRDAVQDSRFGYFNIPREVLETRGISPGDVSSPAYREWVCGQVQLARRYFGLGRMSVSQSKNMRRRLAGCAYVARFEWMLHVIEQENYCLRAAYPERKSWRAGFWMCRTAFASAVAHSGLRRKPVVR